MPKWMVRIDWQGKCKQRGASPGNNDFGDSTPRDPRAWGGGDGVAGRIKGRWAGRGRGRGRGRDPHLPGKVSSEVAGGEEVGAELRGTGDGAAPSRAGDAGRGRGRGGEGRGGREEEGVRGRNLPPLAASLSAPGLGTKGGTLMNSPPLSPGRRVSPPRNFAAAATFPAVRPHASVRAPRGLQQREGPLPRDEVGAEVSGDRGLGSLSPRRSRSPPFGGRRRSPVAKFGW